MNQKTFKILFSVICLLNIFLIGQYLIYPIVGSDSGYYLSIAREFYNGKIYFHEIASPYNPLSIIAFGLPFLFDDNPSIKLHLIINFVIIISSSIVLFNILNFFSVKRINNLFYSSFFILITLVSDGRQLMLEPLSVLFQLIAFYFYLRFIKCNSIVNSLIVGLYICLAFLSKQYGLFIAIPIAIDLFIRIKNNRLDIKYIIGMVFGFSIPIVLFFLYLNFYKIGFVQFLKYLSGKGIELDLGTGTGYTTNFYSYIINPAVFLFSNLYILIIPLMIVKNFKTLDDKKYLFIIAFLSSILVLYFATYGHYFQYIIPFTIILYAYLIQHFTSNKNKKITQMGVRLILISIIIISPLIIYSSFKKERLKIQLENKIVLLNNIPQNSEVYFDGPSQSFYYLCNYRSISLSKIGFSFPGFYFPETIIKNMRPGSFLIVSENRFHLYENLLINYSVKEMYLNTQKYFVLKNLKLVESKIIN